MKENPKKQSNYKLTEKNHPNIQNMPYHGYRNMTAIPMDSEEFRFSYSILVYV